MIVVSPIEVQLLLLLCSVLLLEALYESLRERRRRAHKRHLPLS